MKKPLSLFFIFNPAAVLVGDWKSKTPERDSGSPNSSRFKMDSKASIWSSCTVAVIDQIDQSSGSIVTLMLPSSCPSVWPKRGKFVSTIASVPPSMLVGLG